MQNDGCFRGGVGHFTDGVSSVASLSKNKKPDLRQEFEAAALPFMDALYGRAYSLARHAEEASDLVQETYLRAYRNFSSFKKGTNCKAWLFKILYSIFVNKYRKNLLREKDSISRSSSNSFQTGVSI